MPQQLHKRFSEDQIQTIMESYLNGEITVAATLENLGLKRARFFRLLKAYRDNPDTFTIIPPPRDNKYLRISDQTEKLIIQELEKEKRLIDNKNMPVKFYNYSAVRDDLLNTHKVKISVPTIVKRAKDKGFYLPRREKKIHDR